METIKQTVKILACREEWVLTKFLTIANFAKKQSIFFSYNETKRENVIKKRNNEDIKVDYIEYEVEFESLKINGHTLVGSIDRRVLVDGTYSNILRTLQEVPVDFHSKDIECDHCKTKRTRKKSFLFKKDDGQFVQIGSTCIIKYFGYDLGHVEIWGNIQAIESDSSEEREQWFKFENVYNINEVLRSLSRPICKEGYYPKHSEGSTVQKAITIAFTVPNKYNNNIIENIRAEYPETDETIRIANEVLEYIKSLPETSTFNRNLITLTKTAYVVARDFGMLAYSFVLLLNCKIQKQHKDSTYDLTKNSKHVGIIKEKIEFDAILLNKRAIETLYGTTIVYNFLSEGNLFVWFASTEDSGIVGEKIHVKGAVKKHDEYQGVAQTILTRCKLT